MIILFDLDGTITESGPGITNCVAYALEQMGRPVADKEALRSFIGPPLHEQFMRFAGFDAGEADRAVAYYRQRYTARGIFELTLYPGIEDTLAALLREGISLGVASSKPEIFVRQILDGCNLTGYFSVITGSEMDGRRTEKADVIREALARFRALLKDGMPGADGVFMVGDRMHDIDGAKNCGIRSIGVTYGYGSREELESAGADMFADSTGQIVQIIRDRG